MGGGYVNNWSTEKLRKYTKKGKIILCRDHGGPGKVVEIKRKTKSFKIYAKSQKGLLRKTLKMILNFYILTPH